MHGDEAVSPWVARWAHLVAPGANVLDVACGMGRHAVYFAEKNHPVTLIDRAQEALDSAAARLPSGAQFIMADIENGPWPLAVSTGQVQQFGGVVVTHYLWRALLPTIVASVAPGGVLIYETFAHGNAAVGRPSRPDFLLQPGELLHACAGLRVVAYEDGFLAQPARYVQRIAAVREAAASGPNSTLNTTANTTGSTMPSPPAHEKAENSASMAPRRYLLEPL